MSAEPEALSALQFSRAEGAQDWRLLFRGVCTHVRTSSYLRSLELVAEIGRVCETLVPRRISTCVPRA